ncbi:PREDICTED: uncharacterized protein LOC108756868 [Trachymyrmex septentrionalis]|uniref:uncharacterized protein LOC108756868 n=1 Tax=Trachymyrmex septentrionalis TaxID=34720 RepID=UPI00084F09BE|nr:PREDICTED: uncharacterized protein LOC108756868 [Trachymyrmex septentrionalis]
MTNIIEVSTVYLRVNNDGAGGDIVHRSDEHLRKPIKPTASPRERISISRISENWNFVIFESDLRIQRESKRFDSKRNSLIVKYSNLTREYKMMLMQEPGWKLERKGSGAQVLRKDGSHFKSSTARVCFRCDVEIREFVPDEDYGVTENMEMETAASPLAMLSSCVAALCVTILLPWLLIGG